MHDGPKTLGVRPSESAAADGPAQGSASSAGDAGLVERLRARDEQAFAELIQLYHGPLLRLALGFVPSRAVAEEVVQETWVGVLDGLATFEGRSALKTWIFRILTNRAKTRGVRENRTVPFSGLSDPEGEHEPAVDPTRFQRNGMWGLPPRPWEDDAAEKILMTRQGLKELEAAIAALPPNQRVVVTLRDIEGLDAEEACNVLGISETNQRVLLHRARSKLRVVLERFVERT
jgi:RNA polymerase sigma-70 factor, ECF subfamily